MTKLVAYIRGGVGDFHIAVSALVSIIGKKQISKFDITVIADSVYFFRPHPRGVERYCLDILHKITPNVIIVPPRINNNFKLAVDDVSDELTQEAADKMKNEFMFWRPPELKAFVNKHLGTDTIFIDALFTECIMQWDFMKCEYKRIQNERSAFTFNPPKAEKLFIDNNLLSNPRHILLHVRKKHEGTSYTTDDFYYNSIIKYCNVNEINPIIVGIDDVELKGNYIRLGGDEILSFEGMAYLINRANVMVGNDSGFSTLKLYQQQKDKLLIMDHARWERAHWCQNMIDKSNCIVLDAKRNNVDEIISAIGKWYEVKNEDK